MDDVDPLLDFAGDGIIHGKHETERMLIRKRIDDCAPGYCFLSPEKLRLYITEYQGIVRRTYNKEKQSFVNELDDMNSDAAKNDWDRTFELEVRLEKEMHPYVFRRWKLDRRYDDAVKSGDTREKALCGILIDAAKSGYLESSPNETTLYRNLFWTILSDRPDIRESQQEIECMISNGASFYPVLNMKSSAISRDCGAYSTN